MQLEVLSRARTVRNFDLTATTDYSYNMHDELARPRFLQRCQHAE